MDLDKGHRDNNKLPGGFLENLNYQKGHYEINWPEDKIINYLRGFLENLNCQKGHYETNWPLNKVKTRVMDSKF
jgi:hypothetical protein